MHVRFHTVLACSLFCFTAPAFSATINVDCDAGETISDALSDPSNNLTIDFVGACVEELEIRRGNVRLRGNGGVLQGSIVVSASVSNTKSPSAGRIRLRNFTIDAAGIARGLSIGANGVVDAKNLTVTQSTATGLLVHSGGWLRCKNCDVSFNLNDGLVARDNAQIEFSGNVTISNNGSGGLSALNSASISDIDNDDPNATPATLTVTGNTHNGILLVDGATMRSNGTIIANSNGSSGITVGHGASWRALGAVTTNNNNTGISIFTGTVTLSTGHVTSMGNGTGLMVFEGGSLRVLTSVTVTGNTNGASVSVGFLRILSGTMTPNTANDLMLSFGAKARLGGGVLVSNISCDGTEITSGFVCP